MVATDEQYPAIQLPHPEPGRLGPAEIPEMPHEIVLPDHAVPVGDKGQVHFMSRVEGPGNEEESRFMAEMQVADEEGSLFWDFRLSFDYSSDEIE
jgi:hypothetical protein